MKWDFKIVVLLVEWSSFRGGLKAGFYCTMLSYKPRYYPKSNLSRSHSITTDASSRAPPFVTCYHKVTNY